MTASDDVLDLVQRWAAAEQQSDAGLLEGLLAEGFAGGRTAGFRPDPASSGWPGSPTLTSARRRSPSARHSPREADEAES